MSQVTDQQAAMSRVSNREAAGSTSAWLPARVIVIAALVALAAILRLVDLGRESLWTDEMHTVGVAGVPHGPEKPVWQWKDLLLVTQGPLFMGLVHAWSHVAGTSEAALRLLPAFFAIATVPFFFFLGEKLLARPAADFAALLLAISPFHVWYARELRGYSLLILAAVVSTLLLLRLVAGRRNGERCERAGLRDYVLYAASLLAGLGASLTMVFIDVVHGLVIAARARTLGARRVAALLAVFTVIAIAAAPWLQIFGRRHDVGRAIARPEVEEAPMRGAATMPALAIPYTFYAFSAGFSLGPSLDELHVSPGEAVRRHGAIIAIVAIVYGGLAIGGLALLTRKHLKTALLLAAWIAVPAALTAWMAGTNVKVWNPRYMAVSFPAYLLFAGAGFMAFAPRWRAIAGGFAALLALLAVWNLHHDPDYAKEDYRAAAHYLEREFDRADAVIGVGAPGPLFFYLESAPPAYAVVNPYLIADPEELRRRLAAASGGRPRVWVFRTRTYQIDPANEVGGILGETRRLGARATFHGIEIERYDLHHDQAQ